MTPARGGSLVLGTLALAGCGGKQAMLEGAGYQSQQFGSLVTLFLSITAFFYALVIIGLVAALVKRRASGPDGEQRMRPALAVWVVAVLVGLTVLSVASFVADRRVAAAQPVQPPLEIEITAHQWWWQVEYKNGAPQDQLTTANELHLPVHTPVLVILKSADVIHSFWISPLSGKQDLIPGRTNDTMLLPTRVGLYRGQCAEYCGQQHAHMALDVTVEPMVDFRRWWRAQLRPAAMPATPLARTGYGLVMGGQCASCHNIAGTSASGRVGPDLTHLASRRSIAAGTMPMTTGHLYAWIADPQGVKPGNNMPFIGLDANELHAVVAYLQGLK